MNDFHKRVRIAINSDRYDHTEILLNTSDDEFNEEPGVQHDRISYVTEGTFSAENDRITLTYDDSDLLGGEETGVTLTFTENNPQLVTMLRRGSVSAALVFEAGQRHISIYKTQYIPFEVCIRTHRVRNRLLSAGILEIDYIIEIHGVRAERTRLRINVGDTEEA